MQGKKYSSDFWNKKFLEALKDNMGITTHACKEVRVTPQCYYKYRIVNLTFAKKADRIKEQIGLPMLEDMAQSRAMKSSDRLLVFMLRNLGGKKWNQDRIEEAMAREEPKLLLNDKNKKILNEQRIPTLEEQEAAMVFRKTLRRIRGQSNYDN